MALRRELHWSFKQQGESLPPWRHKDCILSKWIPKVPQDTPVSPPGVPASPTTPTALPGHLAPMPSVTLPSTAGACGSAAGWHGSAALALQCLKLQASPSAAAAAVSQGSRRVIRVPLVGSPDLVAALPMAPPVPAALYQNEGDWALSGLSPDSPTLSWEGHGSTSPLSVLHGSQPFARLGAAGGGNSACGGCAAAPPQRLRGPASLLTRQLQQGKRRLLEV
jgi:hypothetical protein